MDLVREPRELNARSRAAARRGERVGFVPTMGWLHQGHLSLVEAARKQSEKVVVSIFVNPTQFGPGEDFERYPRDVERDRKLCEEAGVDWLFLPDTRDLYPGGTGTYVEVPELGTKLCGRSRPGHFRGVATVVAKLFAIVDADTACFGQKDFQQLVLLRRMSRDLGFRTVVLGCPIVREADGLAMSSRNVHLSREERIAARVLSRALATARSAFAAGERRGHVLAEALRAEIGKEPLARLDYAEVVDPETLDPVAQIEPQALAALAVFLGKTRLIDNTLLDARDSQAGSVAC